MARPEGDLPPGLEYSDDDLRRWYVEPLFHAKVHSVAQFLAIIYGTEKHEAIAFGIQLVKGLETFDQPVDVALNGS
jgi:hypothetical protein